MDKGKIAVTCDEEDAGTNEEYNSLQCIGVDDSR